MAWNLASSSLSTPVTHICGWQEEPQALAFFFYLFWAAPRYRVIVFWFDDSFSLFSFCSFYTLYNMDSEAVDSIIKDTKWQIFSWQLHCLAWQVWLSIASCEVLTASDPCFALWWWWSWRLIILRILFTGHSRQLQQRSRVIQRFFFSPRSPYRFDSASF